MNVKNVNREVASGKRPLYLDLARGEATPWVRGAKKIRENPHNPWLKPPDSVDVNSIIVAIIVVTMAAEVDRKLLRSH